MIVLGLGSNVGDRLSFILQGISALVTGSKPPLRNARVSPIYESDALLLPGSPAEWNTPFFNLALSGETDLKPTELLAIVKGVERSLGRSDRPRWSPRELDIDILAWNDLFLRDDGLNIPHTGVSDRPFAVWPLADLAPHWQFPAGCENSQETAARCAARQGDRFNAFAWDKIPCRTRRADAAVQRTFAAECAALGVRFDDGTQLGCKLVGVVNITPDSFSDGGSFSDPEQAVAHALRLVGAGAEILDLGAESTRPGAEELTPEIEWDRLAPVIEQLRAECRRISLPPILSVDTRNFLVAERALAAGAGWINDVSGGSDKRLRSLVREARVPYVLMHSLSVPVRSEETLPPEEDPVTAVKSWARAVIANCEGEGFIRDQLIIDPGVGFGKTAEQSLALVRRAGELHELGCQLLIGHSRKSFMTRFSDRPNRDRDLETAVCSVALARQGVQYLRLHDVAATARGIRTAVYCTRGLEG